jgi:simple sugar transport system ATP-binding protein
LDELLELSDRIGVVFNGRLAALLDRSEATVETVGALMLGGAMPEQVPA